MTKSKKLIAVETVAGEFEKKRAIYNEDVS